MWLDIQLTCLQAISIGHSPVTKKKKKIVSYFFSTLYLSSIEKKYQQTSDSVCVCVCKVWKAKLWSFLIRRLIEVAFYVMVFDKHKLQQKA